ncbi:hypothetical protein RhiirB3_523907 [Rhizophagus irregularis]|nr:hypothetical protein RhiirB3_523907 [Rhizophagus irregularis]
MSSIKARIYTIGLCYICQECLHCSRDTTPSADAAPIVDATPAADAASITNTTSTADTKNHVPPDESSLDSSTSESSLFELKFKLIIKFSDGKSYPAKWERIVKEDFYSFKDNLEILVQSQLEVQVVFQEYYITSYNMKKKGD